MPSGNSTGKNHSDFEELNYDEEFYFQWHITNECNLRCIEEKDTEESSIFKINGKGGQ
jgi:MoaA/NifB/PqqE/SkfB family radical SAM enzyme